MKLLLAILFLFPIYFFAQGQSTEIVLPRDSNTQQITYTGVVMVDSVSADDLFSRAKFFVADYFVSQKAVTDLTDEHTKTILIKPLLKMDLNGFSAAGYSGYTHYDLKIENKDGRYRYTISNFIYYAHTGGALNPKILTYNLSEEQPKNITKAAWEQLHQRLAIQMDQLVDFLKQYMSKAKASTDF